MVFLPASKLVARCDISRDTRPSTQPSTTTEQPMNDKIQAVRGMHDLLPGALAHWHTVEQTLREVGWQYGYEEIRTPILEKTALFQQSIGEQTDIVEKEMYTFTDRGEVSVTLRPEATASTVRAGIQHGLLHHQQQRFWYLGPMFRRERPQKGRYRQFHQFGLEAFGWSGPDIDSELIRAGERIWKKLSLNGLTLELNTLGSAQSRATYRQLLVDYFTAQRDQLDADSRRRLEHNPLRILDSKIPQTQELVANAPNILEVISEAERDHFDALCRSLDHLGITYHISPKLVRGLDYYTSTVFEWSWGAAGEPLAICAGGRYDDLVSLRGGVATPAIGFAIGLERLVELLQTMAENTASLANAWSNALYFIDATADHAHSAMSQLAEQLRDHGHWVIAHCGGGKLKQQLKRADQSTAHLAVIAGESEREAGVVQIKYLRENIPQFSVPQRELVDWCNANLSRRGQPKP